MDIYGVILIGNMVAATLGPWPAGSMTECKDGAVEIEQRAVENMPKGGYTVNGQTVHADEVAAFCKKFEQRPQPGTTYTGER